MDFKTTRVQVGLLDFEYCASLQLEHPQLDPEAVSRTLNMTPWHSHRAGDPRRTPKGTPLSGVYPTGFWSVDLETRDGEDVAEFLIRIADELKPAKDYLRGIVDNGGEVECFVSLFARRMCDQVFPADLLMNLGQLGIDLRLQYCDISERRATIAQSADEV